MMVYLHFRIDQCLDFSVRPIMYDVSSCNPWPAAPLLFLQHHTQAPFVNRHLLVIRSSEHSTLLRCPFTKETLHRAQVRFWPYVLLHGKYGAMVRACNGSGCSIGGYLSGGGCIGPVTMDVSLESNQKSTRKSREDLRWTLGGSHCRMLLC